MADPEGFLVARLKDVSGGSAAAVVGCIAALRYGASHGFIGYFIVAEQWRKHGIGRELWRAAMRHLGENGTAGGRVIGLNAIAAQQARYERNGFTAAYRTTRFVGVPHMDALCTDDDAAAARIYRRCPSTRARCRSTGCFRTTSRHFLRRARLCCPPGCPRRATRHLQRTTVRAVTYSAWPWCAPRASCIASDRSVRTTRARCAR